jgi:hypothetical protein
MDEAEAAAAGDGAWLRGAHVVVGTPAHLAAAAAGPAGPELWAGVRAVAVDEADACLQVGAQRANPNPLHTGQGPGTRIFAATRVRSSSALFRRRTLRSWRRSWPLPAAGAVRIAAAPRTRARAAASRRSCWSAPRCRPRRRWRRPCARRATQSPSLRPPDRVQGPWRRPRQGHALSTGLRARGAAAALRHPCMTRQRFAGLELARHAQNLSQALHAKHARPLSVG